MKKTSGGHSVGGFIITKSGGKLVMRFYQIIVTAY